jgi:leucyl aminopeptidase
LDIAGTAWTQEGTSERSYNPKGATGFGLRTLVKLLAEDENT